MKLRITAIREESIGVKRFFLMPADGSVLTYRAGQFLTFSIKLARKEYRRSYSFSSTPGIDAMPSITVKRIENGLMSRWLIDHAQAGDAIETVGGATGLFTLPDDLEPYEAVWLFAAGIGITPVFALLQQLLAQTEMPRVVLVYSNRSKEHTVFLQSLEALQAVYGARLTIIHLRSDSRDLRRARLSKEFFPVLLRESLTDNPVRVLSYLCGPGPYMWLLELLLQDAGVPAAAVRREVFVVNKEIPRRLPGDKTAHTVRILIDGETRSFINTYPESILRSAKAAGISLPYSCDAGQCGSCAAICTAGKVWMSYNEVLTERDLLAGRVLTCTGHAVDGDVELAFQA